MLVPTKSDVLQRRQVAAYLDKIDFRECFIVPGLLDVQDRDDVLMVEVAK